MNILTFVVRSTFSFLIFLNVCSSSLLLQSLLDSVQWNHHHYISGRNFGYGFIKFNSISPYNTKRNLFKQNYLSKGTTSLNLYKSREGFIKFRIQKLNNFNLDYQYHRSLSTSDFKQDPCDYSIFPAPMKHRYFYSKNSKLLASSSSNESGKIGRAHV